MFQKIKSLWQTSRVKLKEERGTCKDKGVIMLNLSEENNEWNKRALEISREDRENRWRERNSNS